MTQEIQKHKELILSILDKNVIEHGVILFEKGVDGMGWTNKDIFDYITSDEFCDNLIVDIREKGKCLLHESIYYRTVEKTR